MFIVVMFVYLFVSAVFCSTQSSICNSSTTQVCYDAVHMPTVYGVIYEGEIFCKLAYSNFSRGKFSGIVKST